MSLSDELVELQTAIAGVGTAVQNKDTALTKQTGSNRGVIQIVHAPYNGAFPADWAGFTFETTGMSSALSTSMPASANATSGQRVGLFNPSTFNWTLTTDASFSTGLGTGASIVLSPQTTLTLEWDGTSWNGVSGSAQQGGVTTVSSAAPSGGKSGDIWYQV